MKTIPAKFFLASIALIWPHMGAVYGQETTISVSPVGPDRSNILAVNIEPLFDSQDRAKLWDALEQAAEPTTLLVPALQSVENAVRAQCGSAPPDLIDKLASLNPDLRMGATQEDRELRFIPCPYWNTGVMNSHGVQVKRPTIPVRQGEAIDPIIQQYMGTVEPKSVEAVTRLNPKLIDSERGRIRTEGILILPFVARPAILTLSQTHTQDTAPASLQAIAASLPSKARKTLSVSLSTDEYQLVAADDPSLDNPMNYCSGPGSFEDWPINTDELKRAFDATLALTPQQLLREKAKSVVALADTGIFLSEASVKERLWYNQTYYGGVVDPTSPFKNDPHGASMVTMRGDDSDIEPVNSYPFARHGTEIARVMVEGGLRVESLDKRFSIAIAKLNAQTPPYGIHVSSVPTALNYARRIKASVVNLSVVTGATSELLEGAIHASNALIVSAAGNTGDDPEVRRVYPPALSKYREKLIVVGAHDWNGKPAKFSNWGRSVDILAPGCAIPIPDSEGTSQRLVSGTSFAAPFVTYTAAMLQALYFPESPAIMRSRILAAGRFDPDLLNTTRYGVILDIARTLRFREDSYLPRGSNIPIYGTVDPEQNFFCEISADRSRNIRPRDVLKVIPRYPARGTELVPAIWTQPVSDGIFIETQCSTDFYHASFRFKESGGTEFKNVLWADVQDLVMRATAK